MTDHFARSLRSTDELAELYAPAEERAWRKDIGHIDEMCRRLIAATPLVLVASVSAEGRCDVTPRGGPAGFATVLDDQHLALPDATGNRRLDTLTNVVSTGEVGLLFVIPGRADTLRINGPACVSADPDLLGTITPVGKPPRTAIVVRAAEVYTHCPKAFVRSKLWDPETWPATGALPTPAEVTLAHARDPALTLERVEELRRESLAHRLA
jgi:uncharacterized protein